MPPTKEMSVASSLVSGSTECEKNVIAKLIKLVEIALQCSNGSDHPMEIQTEDEAFVKNFMEILLQQNDTQQGFHITMENSTGPVTSPPETLVVLPSSGGSDTGKSLHRLQHLEMIKVGVLIFVISIIMLTTCRMVFQLFVRFRPEKRQLH